MIAMSEEPKASPVDDISEEPTAGPDSSANGHFYTHGAYWASLLGVASFFS